MTDEKPTIQIDDIQREMTAEEIKKMEETRSLHAAELKIAEDELAAKEAAKALATIKLESLGLTLNDLEALGLVEQKKQNIES